ncbi:MAG: signal peptidase I [Planctomycetota bacterium]|nr:MAG: signal peptidase I [Planctomycetota bacterium]
MTDPDQAASPDRTPDSLKETLISIVIAFALAFVGRSYVIEPFVIPTGSMAPTLNGAHMRFRSPVSGFDWAANPRDGAPPLPVQGSRRSGSPIVVTDPVTGHEMRRFDVPLRAGDRILVLKHLYALFEPKRFDVVVFKNPEQPQENFIKRLLGLPGEEIWLCDGDLFVREPDAADPDRRRWRIARKPQRVQGEVWWPVFSSEYTPIDSAITGAPWRGPWSGAGWDTEGLAYRADSAEPGALEWDAARWPITDETPYNEPVRRLMSIDSFPVSDLRLRAGVEPDAAGLTVAATITARGHEFQGAIADGVAQVRMRAVGEDTWTVLGEGRASIPAGRVTPVEFAHVDQALVLRVGGRVAARGEYDWSPEERLAHATRPDLRGARGALAVGRTYLPPRARWSLGGSPVTLHRVGLDRDLHWRTAPAPRGPGYARGTAPDTTFPLHDREYFMCGDNSPSSRDSRLWTGVDPWVAETTGDSRVGVVHRDLIMGRAFFVYFPSPHHNLGPIPVPDFGRLRFIK